MGEEHLEAILTYARAQGDSETEGIIDALLNMLEYPSWIAYIFSLKQNSAVMELMVAQVSKPGWDSIGGTPVTWSTRWWEQWSLLNPPIPCRDSPTPLHPAQPNLGWRCTLCHE